MANAQMTQFEYEDRILESLKARDGDVTAGDVAADTGLPYEETEIALRRMLSVYKSHLDVDDDGNLRYRFDPALTRRGEEPGRLWHDVKKWSWKAFKLVFKVWIMVTLVGYTVIFLLLLLALAVAGIAASASSDNDSGGDLIALPFYLFARTLEFLFWISLFDDGYDRRGYGRGRRRGGFGRAHRKKPKPEKAFYQKVFDFVFGPEQKRDPLAGQRAFAAFVRSRDGRVTAAEWASRTGQSLDEAENALTASLVRFSGDVDVNDDGVLVYRFDQLRVTADEGGAQGRDLPPVWTKRAQAPAFTGNPKSTNVWISIFNSFNLLMAGAVLWVTTQAAAAGAVVSTGVTIGLGIVPLVFSLIFFAVPLLRKFVHAKKKRAAAEENARREDLQRVFASVRGGEAAPVELSERADAKFVADFDGDVQVLDDGRTVYLFDTLAEQVRAGREAREAADGEVIFGKTVFSSDEEEVSLAQAELDAFDELLSRELEGSHVELESAAVVGVGSR